MLSQDVSLKLLDTTQKHILTKIQPRHKQLEKIERLKLNLKIRAFSESAVPSEPDEVHLRV